MTDELILVVGMLMIMDDLPLEELEIGSATFFQDLEEGANLGELEYLLPHIIECKLNYYEKEY